MIVTWGLLTLLALTVWTLALWSIRELERQSKPVPAVRRQPYRG